MRQVLRAGALGRPRGVGWGERWEWGSGWGTHVNPWLIHVNVWQKPLKNNNNNNKIIKKQKQKLVNLVMCLLAHTPVASQTLHLQTETQGLNDLRPWSFSPVSSHPFHPLFHYPPSSSCCVSGLYFAIAELVLSHHSDLNSVSPSREAFHMAPGTAVSLLLCPTLHLQTCSIPSLCFISFIALSLLEGIMLVSLFIICLLCSSHHWMQALSGQRSWLMFVFTDPLMNK